MARENHPIKHLGQAIEAGEDHGVKLSPDGKKGECGVCKSMRPVGCLADFRNMGSAMANWKHAGFVGDCCRTRITREGDNVVCRRAKRRGQKIPTDQRAVPEHVLVYCMGDKVKGLAMKRHLRQRKEAAQAAKDAQTGE